MSKVILAFSGGLDTSFAVPYLQDLGHEVITVSVDTGGFNKQELKAIKARSASLGAIKHYQVDGRKSMYDSIVSYIIKANGIYENSYPNMCSDRYIIAEETVKIAKKENASAIAHGSSAMGNDQVRFDVALMGLNPAIKIITPTRDTGGDRKKQEDFLASKGFATDSRHKKYSVNQNILGITYSGSEIDDLKEPDESMFQWTKPTREKPTYATIDFEHGVPTKLDGKKLDGADILIKLNSILGSYGYGRGFYTGDCVVGIKGHIVFEAPGILGLIQAHVALEQLVHTKTQYYLGKRINEEFSELLYNGRFYDPAVNDIKAFIDSQQQRVTGRVKLKIVPGQIQPVEISSPNSLINSKIASYAQNSSWTPEDAVGFIKLYGMQCKIASLRNESKK